MNESVPKAQTQEALKKIENHKIKIIVAEDDKSLQEFYVDMLSGVMGYNVELVKSGEALLEKLAGNAYNLVITDNNMIPGGKTGLDVLEQIRTNEKLNNLPKLPIIVCSGDTIKRKVEEKDAVFLSKSATLDWNNFQTTIERSLVEARDQKIRDMLLVLYSGANYLEANKEVSEQDKRLMEKYGEDRRKRTIFHALASSTPDPEKHNVLEDFPGEDSVEKFMEALYQKYKK